MPQALAPAANGLSVEDSKIIMRARSLKQEMQEVVNQSHAILENSSGLLKEYYRTVPSAQLSERIRQSFDNFDTDKSEALDRNELREAMAEMGHRPDDAELDALFAEWDLDNSGTIEPDEFEHMVLDSLGIVAKCKCRVCAAKKAKLLEDEMKEVAAMEQLEISRSKSAHPSTGGNKAKVANLNQRTPSAPTAPSKK